MNFRTDTRKSKVTKTILLIAAILVVVSTGCVSTGPADHSYVTDYQVIGDRSVKYIYIPGERSEAGEYYLDQALAVEICSLVEEEVELADGADAEDQESPARGTRVVERDCVETRILKTEEYR